MESLAYRDKLRDTNLPGGGVHVGITSVMLSACALSALMVHPIYYYLRRSGPALAWGGDTNLLSKEEWALRDIDHFP